jgi:putative nucleotidyltransferase with HDIG domain
VENRPHAVEATVRDPSPVAVLITLVASVASALLVATATSTWHHISARPWSFLGFLLLTFVLQIVTVDVYGKGTLSFAGTGFIAIGIAFGAGPAMATATLMGAVVLLRKRGKIHRGVFDAGNFCLAAGGAAGAYHLVAGWHASAPERIAGSLVAAAVYCVLNVGLLCVAMSLSESASPLAVWNERFRWFTPYYLASGPLGVALTTAYDRVGVYGMLAFALPPAMMMFSVRQYTNRTRQSVEEVRQANEELRCANVALAERNEDLRELFEFAGGLAARAHDRGTLIAFAEESLSRLTGTKARLALDPQAGQIALLAGGSAVGSLELGGIGLDVERWHRLRDAILPQLATALESTDLIDQVRKKHLATIAALSRSMEAKDYYTGGHTERVSEVAVSIAKRLGFEGADLDAIEIGALLHDIGKIGIPERILHKPGPLDEEEWKVMKEHPVISDYILSEVDLHPFVRQIARWSHERIDGKGYPDGLAGEQIPLPARIALVADAFDALTSDRPYRRGRHIGSAIEELREHAGSQFCDRCVAALEDVWREEPYVLGAGHLRAVEAGAA